MFNRLFGFVAVLFLIFAFASPVLAQDVAGITGTVTDKTGSAVSDASVKLTDTRTGAVYETKTGSFGAYTFTKVAPGPGYSLTIAKDSFKTITVSNLYLAVATVRTQDVVLELGVVSQTVEVKAEGSVSLNTTDTSIGSNIDIRQVESLPQQFRDNPSNLLRLEPGVVNGGDGNTDTSGSRDGSVAGARTDQNNIIVDGIDAQDFAIGQAFAQSAPIPVDAIQEFRTEVGNPTAEYGRASGAQTIIITKGGTNQWHGEASEFHRNTVAEANSFFNNLAGVPRPNLIRNQFGADLGGPAIKDKLFFFFDYEGRRDASQSGVLQAVPLDHVRAGGIAYINNNAGCTPSSRLTSADVSTNCVTILNSAQLTALDPCSAAGNPCAGAPGFTAPGFDPALLTFINSRYPHANDFTQGDGINTAGFRFNAPAPVVENIYTTRIDYNLNSKQKIFTRFNFRNENAIETPIAFPGDPVTAPIIIRDKSWVIGHTWTFSANTINQFVYGEARNELAFPINFNPGGTVFPLNWFPNTPLSNPFDRQSAESRIIPLPTIRDDVTLLRGRHQIQVGGVWKPIRTRSTLVNDFDFINVGVGGAITSLANSGIRPGNILQDPNGIAGANFDAYFLGFLGVINQDQSVFNYGKTGTTFNHGTGERRDYRYYNYEAYAQDSFKLRSDFTVTYGLRYQYDSVPYETSGLEAFASNTNLNQQLAARVASGLQGRTGPNITPLLTYTLAGKNNPGGAPLYNGDKLNFSPRLALAWNPGFRDGVLSRVLGDRKTVIRMGGALIFDQTALNSINFLQDQGSYLFGNVNSQTFSAGPGSNAQQNLATDPRFTAINSLPFTLNAPPFQNPLTPFTAGSGANLVAFGAASGAFNYTIDPKFKTPYSITYSAGIQRELPGNFQLEVDYYGRVGRRLFTLADAAQVVDFHDPGSNQNLVASVTALELAARNNVDPAKIVPIPFFESVGAQAFGGAPCSAVLGGIGFTSCTQFIYANNFNPLAQGNLAGVVLFSTIVGLFPAGVGFPPQFAANAYVSNKGWSSYNSMFVTLRKRLSRNLQMDFNYTLSHSIDNASLIANNNGNGVGGASVIQCNALNGATCRGNSEFDATHQIITNFVYDLPIGRGQPIGRNSGRLLDEAIGGWQISGIVGWRTGLAFPVQSGSSVFSAAADALAIFNGNKSAIASGIHTDTSSGTPVIQYFANKTSALAAFSNVTGQEVGNRDILRGPGFSNWDLGVAKNFPLWSEKYKLQLRVDAFNAFNHPNFALPNANINSPNFGIIGTTTAPARVLQGAIRFDF